MLAHEQNNSCFFIYLESKAEWQCNMSMTKYWKYQSDGLWSTKWMRWTMVDERNEVDYGRWNETDKLWFINTKNMEWW